LALFFALYYLLRPELFHTLMAQILDAGFLLSGIVTSSLSLIVASFASKRICLGLNGWIRHLPLDGKMHRRMAGIAIFIAQIPLLAVLGGLAVIATKLTGVPVSAFIAGLPFVGLACGLWFLPVKNMRGTRALALLAAVGFSSNDWALLSGSILLLIAAEMISGPLVNERKQARFHKFSPRFLFTEMINWRALGWRMILPFLLSLFPLGAAKLFISNNDPSPRLAEQMIRLGSALGLVLFCSLLSHLLASRRPPWPWIRTLPWTAKSRIVRDSIFLSIHALPVVALGGILNVKSLLPVILSLPALAVYSACAIRQASGSTMGAFGKILPVGSLGALLLCLVPWSTLCILALTPWILHEAVKAEKHQKVSRWLELHHLAAGDSLSWSAE
jgi:hypothetical protein